MNDLNDRATEPQPPEDPSARVQELLEHVTESLGLTATVTVQETEEEILADVEGDDLGLLIGKHGATIDALQHLAVRVAYKGTPSRKTVLLDAAGYRDRREAALQRAAEQGVDDALSYGRPVELEPMSAQERRIVHTYLRDRTDVQTHSEGDEPERRLVISPVRQAT